MEDKDLVKLCISRLDKDARTFEDALGISEEKMQEIMDNTKRIRNLIHKPGDEMKNELFSVLEKCKTPGEMLYTMSCLGSHLAIAGILPRSGEGWL